MVQVFRQYLFSIKKYVYIFSNILKLWLNVGWPLKEAGTVFKSLKYTLRLYIFSRIRNTNVLRFCKNPRTSGEFPVFVRQKLCWLLESVHETCIINRSVLALCWNDMSSKNYVSGIKWDICKKRVPEKILATLNKIWSCVPPYTLHIF